ncbi:MAG: hypothetical protein ACLFT2_03855 [Candidatus Brocadiia bacterium]
MKRTICSVIFLLTLFGAGLRADPEPEYIHGHTLGHAYLKQHWSKVLMNVSNPGEQGARLNSVLTVRDRLKSVKYSRPFYMPPGSERQVWFYAQLGDQKSYPVTLFDDQSKEISEGGQQSNVLSDGRMLILRIDQEEVLPSMAMYLGQREGYRKDPEEEKSDWSPLSGSVRRTATLSTRQPDFPDYWAGLDSMSAVALGEVNHADWRPSQVNALRTWLHSGGVLLIFPGDNYRSLEGSPLEPFLPVEIYGSYQDNNVRLEGDQGEWEIQTEDYARIVESEVVDGRTLFRDGDLPMVVEKKVGLGSVYFIAVPGKVIDQWDARSMFLTQLLRGQERLKPMAQTGLLEKGPKMLDEVAGAEVAPRSFVVWTLGGFLLFAALTLGVAHWRHRNELAWVVIIPVGIVLAIVVYQVGRAYRRQVGSSINEIAVLSAGSGSPLAFRSAILGIHTERKLRCDFEAGEQGALFTSLETEEGDRGGEFTTRFIEVSPRFKARDMQIESGAFPRFVVDSVVDLEGGISADLQLGPDGVEGTITNNSPLNLEQGLMAINGYPFTPRSVESLSSGKSAEVVLDSRTMKSQGDFTTDAVLGSTSLTRKRIVEHLFSPPRTQPFSPWRDRLFLLAWPDRHFISETLHGAGEDMVKRSQSLLCVETTISPAPPGEKVRLPHAFSTPAIRPGDGDKTFRLAQFLGETMPPKSGLMFYLPPFAWNVEINSAELMLLLDAYGYEIIIRGQNMDTGETVELARMENPDGRRRIEIPRASRFQDKERGTLMLQIEARPIDDGSDSAQSASQPQGQDAWSLREATVSVEGTAREPE